MKKFMQKIFRNFYKIWSLNLRIVTLFSRMEWVFECKRKSFFQNFMRWKNHDKFVKNFNIWETGKRAFQNLNFRKVYWEKFLWKKSWFFEKNKVILVQAWKWEPSFWRWMGSLGNFTSTHFKISKENLIE